MYSIKPHGVASTNVSQPESINRHEDNLANHSEKNGVAAKVSGVFNSADMPAVTSRVSMDENRAASLITKCLRQVIANKSYNHMFQHGEMWSARAEGQTKFGFRAMQKLSSENIRQLSRELAPLNQEEISFLDNLLQMPFTATHASDANIVNEKGILSLFSRKKLEQRGMEFDVTHSESDDLRKLSNEDFVFFSLEPGTGNQKRASRFGHTLYSVNFNTTPFSQVSWGSLQEQVLNKTGVSVEQHIPGLNEESYQFLIDREIINERSMYLGKDLKVGLGLSLIKLLRELPQEDKLILLASRSSVEVNRLVNGIYRPEIKVPRHFFTREGRETFLCGNGVILSASELDDKGKILNAIKLGSNTLLHASERLKGDVDVVMAALAYNINALQHAAEKFKDNKALVSHLISQSPAVFAYASDRLKDDIEIVESVVKKKGYLIQYASERLRDNAYVAELAVRNSGYALKFVSDRLKNDTDFVKIAIFEALHDRDAALQYSPLHIKDDFDFVLAAVKYNGYALRYASERLKDNRDVVSVAVKNTANAFIYASDNLKNDKEIVMQVVKSNGMLLLHASFKMKDDIDIVSAAIQQNKNALKFASEEIKNKLSK